MLQVWGLGAPGGNRFAGEGAGRVAGPRRHGAGGGMELPRLQQSRGGGIEDGAAWKAAPEDVGAEGAALQRDEIGEVRDPAAALEIRGDAPHPRARLLGRAPLVVEEPESLRADRRTSGRHAELVRQK